MIYEKLDKYIVDTKYFKKDTPKDNIFEFACDIAEIHIIGKNEKWVLCVHDREDNEAKEIWLKVTGKALSISSLIPNISIIGYVRVLDESLAELVDIKVINTELIFSILECGFCGAIDRDSEPDGKGYDCPICGGPMYRVSDLYNESLNKYIKRLPLS